MTSIYDRLSPDERAHRRASMRGQGWTDPRDFGSTLGEVHLVCPVADGAVMRRDYCWERCPSEVPVSECPRRREDPEWWWSSLIATQGSFDDGLESPATADDLETAVEPDAQPESESPTTGVSRKRQRGKIRNKKPDPAAVDVFDLFGAG